MADKARQLGGSKQALTVYGKPKEVTSKNRDPNPPPDAYPRGAETLPTTKELSGLAQAAIYELSSDGRIGLVSSSGKLKISKNNG